MGERASASSSSDTAPPEAVAGAPIDLASASLLPPIPSALLRGEGRELLAPLTFTAGAADPGPPPPLDRRAIAEALAVANAGYGHPRAAEMAERLTDPATRVVVTGQQPGLFGGPLYTLGKAVAAARWVERFEAAGEPAVAVFWVATEDHDFREVSQAVFLAADGPRSFDLGDDEAPLVPVGMRALGPAVEEVLRELAAANPGDRWRGWVERMAGWYRPDARFGEAFGRLLAALLGDRCPLLLDAMLPALKEAERPWMRQLVERRAEVDEAVAAREQAIVDGGHELQVTPQPGASPLFVLRGSARRRVEWRGGGRIGLRGDEDFDEDVSWLLAAIDENPGVVSPGVTARTALQDAALGTSVLVLGPGEVSYMPQVAPLYELLDIHPPLVHLRPQVLVLAAHQLDKLEELDLRLEQLIASELDLDRALSAGREEEVLAPARERIDRELERLREAATDIDASLAGPWKKTRGQVQKALGIFSGKLAEAVARRREIDRRRAVDLRDTCRPLGRLQERVLSSAHFPGKYGDRFVTVMFEQMELDSGNLQVILP